jgi:hypothetical protein
MKKFNQIIIITIIIAIFLSSVNTSYALYDPTTGRFNRMDPFTGKKEIPQSLHKYAYCQNDPVNRVDPSGQFSIAEISFTSVIQSMLCGIHSFAVHQAGARAADRLLSAYSGYYANNLPKDKENATIIVHGIAQHSYGWSSDFISEMKRRAPNQDYFEYIWSGFTMTGTLPSYWSRNTTQGIATHGLTNATRAIQAKGYRNVNIIAHSWGTVISRDAQYNNIGAINTWVTMGSPMARDFNRPDNLQQWINIFTPGDPVIYSADPQGWGVGGGCLWQRQYDLRQVGYYAPFGLASHSSYWTEPLVHNTIGNRLKGQ